MKKMKWTEHERLMAILQITEALKLRTREQHAWNAADTIEKLCTMVPGFLNANQDILRESGVEIESET